MHSKSLNPTPKTLLECVFCMLQVELRGPLSTTYFSTEALNPKC